jgi:PEGA domain
MKGPPSGAAAGRAQQGPLFQDGTYLVIEVTPPDAHVYLDGRWLGSAATLSRGQIPILPGKRTIAVIRPGYRPYVTEFIARPVGIPTRFRVILVPDRSP